MGKVLFKLFGFDVSILKLLMGVGAAVVIYLAFDTVRDHFQHIEDLETENEQLGTKVTRVEGQRDAAIDLNRQNREAAELKDDIDDNNQEIAAAERAAARERTQTYREIRNAINSAPDTPASQPEEPIAPIINDTLGRLWDDAEPAGTGDTGGDPNPDGVRGTRPSTP